MIILYSFSDVRLDCQQETREAVRQLSLMYDVVPVHCVEPHTYWNGMRNLWGTDTLINIEQDIVPTEAHIESLANCPEPACTFPYRFTDNNWSIGRWITDDSSEWMVTTHDEQTLPDDNLARYGRTLPTNFQLYDAPLPDYANFSGIGLCKIGLRVQNAIDANARSSDGWSDIDRWLSQQMAKQGFRWHVHRESVRHTRPANPMWNIGTLSAR